MTLTKPDTTTSLIGKWKTYPAYKDSGMEWLGEIPEHWEVRRLKYIARLSYGDSLPADTRAEGETTVFGSNGPVGFHSEPNTLAPALVIGRKGSFGKINFSDHPCFAIDTTYFIDSRNSKENLRWLFYSLSLLKLDSISEDSAIPGLSRELTEKQWLPVMPPSEQCAIATFLDRETAKINTLIAKKERLVELLQEKRAALISQAVTKGLDPAVPMNDSGVDWLGEIPASWTINKIGIECIVKARLGWKGLKASEYVDEGYIFLATPNIKGREIDFQNVNYITAERYFESPEIMLKVGDVLIAKDGSTLGITSVIRYLPNPATVNSSIAVIRPDQSLDSIFLYWFLSANYIQGFIQRMKDGMGVPHLFQADLRKFVVLVPPLTEQQAIANYLDHETAKIDALISRIREGIEKLKEYSTALISAAVTGKIDVRQAIGNDRDTSSS